MKKITDPAEIMAADGLIKAAKSDKYQRAYFLGPYARRVSFASQQHRVLNLIWALAGRGAISETMTIAVIGGGLSGIMASIALAQLGCKVVLLEKADQLLNRQANCYHRYIHPTINQWPEVACRSTTRLPYFDWLCGSCDQIMRDLDDEWAELAGKYKDKIFSDTEATVLKIHEDDGKVELEFDPDSQSEYRFAPPFDSAIITSGFADEAVAAFPFLHPYWEDDSLEKYLRDHPKKGFVISGCGDGGLIDAIRVIHRKVFRKGELIVDIARMLRKGHWGPAENIIRAENDLAGNEKALAEAMKVGSPALKDVYIEAAKNLPDEAKKLLEIALINKRKYLVKLVCREKFPFAPLAAPIHKLLLAHALNERLLRHIQGDVVRENIFEDRLILANGEKVEGKVVIRHGAGPNFQQFLDTLADAEKLKERQILLAENYDEPAWATGDAALQIWPPKKGHGPYDASAVAIMDDRLRRNGTKLIDRLADPFATLRCDENSGFCLTYTDKTNQEKLDRLPNELFGFPLEKVKKFEDAETADAKRWP